LDLDDFKKINESMGHEAGDALLIQIAQRIQSHIRHRDILGRLGGDE
ncbi:MAG TPA: diguanylate cyclase, partial [Methylophaga sp.]|nr:diguanylate cyclase [Methylophaga sp.]